MAICDPENKNPVGYRARTGFSAVLALAEFIKRPQAEFNSAPVVKVKRAGAGCQSCRLAERGVT